MSFPWINEGQKTSHEEHLCRDHGFKTAPWYSLNVQQMDQNSKENSDMNK